jgi:Spy/CpxP family protein refolding chaperone
MKKIIFAVMMVAILATTALALAMAQDWGKGPGMGMGYGPYSGGPGLAGPGRWGALNLTPEQVEKMKALRKSFFEQALHLRNELMSKKLELKALWVQTNPDEGKILAKQKEINDLRAQLGEKVTSNRLEMRKILTSEQQAQLVSLLGRHRVWHRYGGGREFGPCSRHHHRHHHHHHDEGMGMDYGPRW